MKKILIFTLILLLCSVSAMAVTANRTYPVAANPFGAYQYCAMNETAGTGITCVIGPDATAESTEDADWYGLGAFFGNGLGLDGGSEMVDMGHSLNMANPWAWSFRWNGSLSNGQGIIGTGTGNPNLQVHTSNGNTMTAFYITTDNSDGASTGCKFSNGGQWESQAVMRHYVLQGRVANQQCDDFEMWIDGVKQSAASVTRENFNSNATSVAAWHIGGLGYGSTGGVGTFDEVLHFVDQDENGFPLNIGEILTLNNTNYTLPIPPPVAAGEDFEFFYNTTNVETKPQKFDVNLINFNLSNSTKAYLVYVDQVIEATNNITNETNGRFSVNMTPNMVAADTTNAFFWNFTIVYNNASTALFNTSNTTQTVSPGCLLTEYVIGVNNILAENQTYVSRVNVSTPGLCELSNLLYQYDGNYYTQTVSDFNTTPFTDDNYFDFNVDIPHTYNNNSNYLANVTATFSYRNTKTTNMSKTSNVHWNLTKHPRFNISAYDLINNTYIADFTAFKTGRAIPTANGSVFWWEFGAGVHQVGVNNTNYEVKYHNLTFTEGTIQNQVYYIYTTNSFNFTFKDEITNQIIGQNISLEFVGDAKSYNFTAQNGALYVDLLVPSNYTIRYQSNVEIANFSSGAKDYGLKRSYLIELTEQSHQDLELYLLENSNSTTTKVTVYDQNTLQGIEGAAVYVQRYFLGDNAYRTVAMCSTGIAGECDIDLQHQEELYKFKVEFPWLSAKITTVPSYISTTTLNLYINLFKTLGEDFFDREGITGNIIYSSSTPTFTASFTDSQNLASQVCLQLKTYGQYSKTLLNESCTTSSSGSLSVTGFAEDKNNYGVLIATIDGDEKVIKTAWKDLYTDQMATGSSGLFLTAIIFIIMALLSVVHVYAVVLGSVGLLFAWFLGIIVIELNYIILILASSIILAMIIQMKK
jgi:hypothetical protein